MAKDPQINQWALTLLRVVLGIIFIYHGYIKLFVTGGFKGTIAFFSAIGIPAATYSALVVALAEFIGGLLLLIGLLTRWTTLVLIFEMTVAFFVVHLKNGLLVSKGGYELVLILIASLVVILTSGAGKISIGKLFKNKNLQ